MSAPNYFDETTEHISASPSTPESSDMTRQDIEHCIARAGRLRAEQFAIWGGKFARNWSSLFRRSKPLLPTHTQSRDRTAHSVQL